MFNYIEQRYSLIRDIISKNNGDVEFVDKAYSMARSLHKDQLRKDGTPYIGHPVEVALILANLGFGENVISGALLHDVVEDCGCTLNTIEQEFNKTVAELVDCVSAIDQAKFVFDEDDIYENKDFEKAAIEEQSFKKLVAIGKKNPLGFCIKFADRIHNLSTIEIFPHSKQLEKVRETEKWIIPIAKALNAEYFYRELKNLCFKIVHRYDGEEYFKQYNTYHNIFKPYNDQLKMQLKELLSDTPIKSIKINDVMEYKIFEDLKKLMKTTNIGTVSQGQILKVTNYNMYFLYEKSSYEEALDCAWDMITANMSNKLKIIDAKIGSFTNRPYFQLEDCYKNKFNLYIMTSSDYATQRLGTLNGQINDFIDYELDNLGSDLIKVKTRSGEIKYIPKNSTALDFAFKIHRDIGLGFKYAIINDSKTQSPPYAKLYDGDQVKIIVEKNSSGAIIQCADLKWFAYVNNDLSKKILIKYFQNKI